MFRRIALAGILVLGAGILVLGAAGSATTAQEWLAICGKCITPSIFSKTGIGTANAIALARVTPRDAEGYCANWQPGADQAACVREQLATPEAQETYRASADCIAGRITPIDGKTYRLDGAWRGGIGDGRTRWRDASGRVVGRDNASGGLGISQQWELLCPKPVPAQAAPTRAARPPTAPAFKIGQAIEAQHGRQWVRGKVTHMRRVNTGRGPETHYEVVLENRQRGVVPARMLRVPATR